MGKRNLYLDTKSVDEALNLYLCELHKMVELSYETIPVVDSLHRVTRNAIFAKYNSPLYNASAMDGIAVIAERTKDASEMCPLVLKDEDYVVVDTGDPIKYPFDAVIMAEDIIEKESGELSIISPAASWQHVRPIGEDIVANEMILPSAHKIRPIDIGVLLSAGILEVEVVKEVHVAIFATGTEIIEPTDTIVEGSIIESNSRVFENLIKEIGAIPHRLPILIDDYDLIKESVSKAVEEYDMVIINAGSSAGRDDYTVHVLRELGEVYVHGVAIKPGKPVILASVKNKPVIGLPGYPVSAYIGFENFVKPTLSVLMNTDVMTDTTIKATITKRLVSSLKHKEYVRVKVGVVDGKFVAAPLARGAGAAMSLVRADGFCVIEQNSEGLEAGDEVSVVLYRNVDEIKNTVVVIGSHDLLLDVMADMMPNMFKSTFISSTHVGSMGGLMALKRHEAHLAPIHLLDGASGEYNISYVKKLFNEPFAIIKGVHRVQGLLVKKGNPLNITGIHDLVNYRFVNRQRGAGTRILLDYLLKKEGINTTSINGYDREATTHMAVAALVGSDSADVGMGIESAARAMNLDFIKVGIEEYDFAIPQKYLELPEIKRFIALLKSEEFKSKVEELGGYEYGNCGEVILL